MKRPAKLFIALAALALVAAACAGDDTTPGDEGAAPFTIGAGEPIKIAGLLAIEGAAASLGKDSDAAVKLAIDYLDGKFDGKNGQLLGHDIQYETTGTGCNKEGGQAAATKVAADPKVLAAIGTTCTSEALGVADKIMSDKKILLISPSNTNPNLTAEGVHEPYYLRTAHNDRIQGAIVAEFAAKSLGVKTAATIHDESPYADALAQVFRDNFVKLGGTITTNGDQAIKSTDTDMKTVLTSIAQDKPDFLYFPDFQPACGLIAKQAKDIPGLENTVLTGSDGCLEPTYLQVGKAVHGTYGSGPDFSELKKDAFYKDQLLPAYKNLVGTDPTAAFHAHAWDAANMLFEAIKKTGETQADGSIKIDRVKLKDAVYATKDVDGLSGTITCTPLGDCATAVTIALYKAPDWPVAGGTPGAKPVFSRTLTLAEAS